MALVQSAPLQQCCSVAVLEAETLLESNGGCSSSTSSSYCIRRLQGVSGSRRSPYSLRMPKAISTFDVSAGGSSAICTPGHQFQGCSQTAGHSRPTIGFRDAAQWLRHLQHAWKHAKMTGEESAQQLSRQLYLDTAMQLASHSMAAALEALQQAAMLPLDSVASGEAIDRAEALMEQSIRRTKLAAGMAAVIMHAEQQKLSAAAAVQQQMHAPLLQQQAMDEEDGEEEVSSCWHPCH